jgi:hypothetical protein
MELQRILAKDTQEAMAKVHALYGNDALVISNKKARKQTEVIVAIDVAAKANETSTSLNSNKSRIFNTAKSNEPSFNEVIESKIFNSPAVLESKSTTRSPTDAVMPTHNILCDEDISSLQDREYLKTRELVDLVKKELSAMRRELKISQQLETSQTLDKMTPELGSLISSLDAAGIPAPLRILVSNLIAKESEVNSAIKLISKSLGSAIKHNPLIKDMKGIHVIAGRSSSENALMSLRLAKQKSPEYSGQGICIINYSSEQTKGWSQTQILGLQSGIKTYHAGTPSALSHVIAGLEEPKLIIIETSGIDLQNQLTEICTEFPSAKKHLLLPADASEVSVNRYLKRDRISWDSVMLNQLDRDIHPWPIINALMATGNAISVASSDFSLEVEAFSLDGTDLTRHSLSNLPLAPK